MAVVPLTRTRPRPRFQGFGDVTSRIVTPGVSTYPSEDGTFAIVRGTGEHYGNGLIDGWIVGGVDALGYYALDDNNTGSMVDDVTVGRRYKAGAEYQTFIDDTPTSPEYGDYLKAQEAADEAKNPLLKAFRDALHQWVSSGDWKGPVGVDGLPIGGTYDQAPAYVQAPWAAFMNAAKPAPAPAPASTEPARYLQNGLETYADGTPVPGGYNALDDYYRQAGVTPGVVNDVVLGLIKQNPALVSALPADEAAAVNQTLQGLAGHAPSSGTNPAAPAAGGSVPTWVWAAAAVGAIVVFGSPTRKRKR